MEGGQVEGGETELLLSSERLSSDSPVMWPDQQHFCKDCEFVRRSPHSLPFPQLETSIL